jgi:hypothetical protein
MGLKYSHGDRVTLPHQAETLNWATNFEDTDVFIERVISYWSRVLKPAEKNYSATKLEALAAKDRLIHSHPLIEGEIIAPITDHTALTWASAFSNVNTRLMKWGTIFASYPRLNIVHRAGRTHSNVDPLSHMKRNIPFFESPVVHPT